MKPRFTAIVTDSSSVYLHNSIIKHCGHRHINYEAAEKCMYKIGSNVPSGNRRIINNIEIYFDV